MKQAKHETHVMVNSVSFSLQICKIKIKFHFLLGKGTFFKWRTWIFIILH